MHARPRSGLRQLPRRRGLHLYRDRRERRARPGEPQFGAGFSPPGNFNLKGALTNPYLPGTAPVGFLQSNYHFAGVLAGLRLTSALPTDKFFGYLKLGLENYGTIPRLA